MDYKSHFILGDSIYVFRQQGAIFREYVNNMES